VALQDDVLADLHKQVAESLTHLKTDLAKLRTGRANLSLLDNVRVNYYGNPTPLTQCANLAVADARLITVKPWDKKLIQEIDKAIRQADIGITPQSDGELIRLPIPALNEQRRKDLVKQAKSRGEDAKIAIRNHRRDANELLKEAEKEHEISQDDLKRCLEKVQQEVDKGIADIDHVLAAKEKEILEV
jgi:ribosome recycling factor